MAITIQLPSPEAHPDLPIDDVIALMVPQKWTAHDKELFQTKWWDYRFMTPFEATLAYIDQFGIAARKLYARDIDYERAQHIRVVSGDSIKAKLLENDDKAKRAFTGYWRGRQVADAIGAPYEVYVAEAMSSRMRAWQRAHLPTANQVYRDIDVERVSNRWEELKVSRIYYAEHHAYLAQNYCGEPTQDAYFAYLIERAGQTGDRLGTLSDMIEADRLPVEYAQAHLDQGTYERITASLQ